MYARLRCGGNLPQCLAFGTGEGLLWYGICVPCSKRLPVVRDASSRANRTADSTDCGQPPGVRDAFQRRAVPKAAPAASSVRETAPLGGEQT